MLTPDQLHLSSGGKHTLTFCVGCPWKEVNQNNKSYMASIECKGLSIALPCCITYTSNGLVGTQSPFFGRGLDRCDSTKL